MASATREIAACDLKLRDRRRRLLAENEPDNAANLREEIDDLLETRFALSEARRGRAR